MVSDASPSDKFGVPGVPPSRRREGTEALLLPSGFWLPSAGPGPWGRPTPASLRPDSPLFPLYSSIFHVLFPTHLRATRSHPDPDHPSPSQIPIFPGLKDDGTSSESPFFLQAQEPLLFEGFFFFFFFFFWVRGGSLPFIFSSFSTITQTQQHPLFTPLKPPASPPWS